MGTPTSARISDLLPAFFESDPPTVDGESPLVYTASLLRVNEAHLLPATAKRTTRTIGGTEIELCEAFGGYSVLKKASVTKPSDSYVMLWMKSGDFPVWVGTCKFSDPFEHLMTLFKLTRFGGAVLRKGMERNLVSLGDLVGLLRSGILSSEMLSDEVSSEPLFISADSAISEAIGMMLANHIRRLFIRGRPGVFLSDRTLVDFLFSPGRLELARDRPERWAEEAVSAVRTKTGRECPKLTVAGAAQLMGDSPDDCLLTSEGRVITRWDLVMKPWMAGMLDVRGG